MKIGFIGLGIMGRPMAKNLLKAGYDITVGSRSPDAAAELEGCGARVDDPPTIGTTCDLVLTRCPTPRRLNRSCWVQTALPPTCSPAPPLLI